MTDNKVSKEDEYFAKKEFERRRQAEEEHFKAMAEEEKNRLRELHHMRCPKCGMELVELDHKNLKIDKCSHCEGVWLDAGELDQIAADESGSFTGFLKLFK